MTGEGGASAVRGPRSLLPRSLRARLLLSHVLPILVIVPLVGLALVYFIESRILLPNLLAELSGQAAVIADLAVERPELWDGGALADAFVNTSSRQIEASVSLLDASGVLLASSDDADSGDVGLPAAGVGMTAALAGQRWQGAEDRPSPAVDLAVATAPVMDPDNTVLGVVRLEYPLTGFQARLAGLRILVAVVSLVALVLGALLGFGLAATIGRPLARATADIQQMATTRRLAPLEEAGPTEARLLVRAFNTLAQRLAATEESRRQLLANLVHELARPLGAIRAAAQTLQDPAAAQDTRLTAELLAGVEGETRRLERLVDDLTGLYQELSGGFALTSQPLPLSDWLAEFLPPWRAAATQRGLTWSTDIPADLPAVAADPDRLGQALGNVISNALKYTPVGGSVILGAAATATAAVITVRDTGPGITGEEQKRIFDAFYRGPSGRRFPQGMGLGLSIARDILAAHGGSLTVASEPGRGSIFSLRLPLHTSL